MNTLTGVQRRFIPLFRYTFSEVRDFDVCTWPGTTWSEDGDLLRCGGETVGMGLVDSLMREFPRQFNKLCYRHARMLRDRNYED